jgi:ClpX C4-type zinc finger
MSRARTVDVTRSRKPSLFTRKLATACSLRSELPGEGTASSPAAWRTVKCLATLDRVGERLLDEARRAQARLIEAEHDAEVARAQFDLAVRRLHLHGSSLREIAAMLGLSHQRVHQIVEAAGGSRRWGHLRDPGAYLRCKFCGRPQREVRKLIAGPGVYICEACVAMAGSVVSTGNGTSTQLGPMEAVPEQDRSAGCSFCGKGRGQVTGLAAVSVGTDRGQPSCPAICRECLALCNEIVADELA